HAHVTEGGVGGHGHEDGRENVSAPGVQDAGTGQPIGPLESEAQGAQGSGHPARTRPALPARAGSPARTRPVPYSSPMNLPRPRLRIRYARGGALSSSTTTRGHVFFGLLASLILASSVAGILGGHFVFLVGVVVSLPWLLDLWAWLAATSTERA